MPSITGYVCLGMGLYKKYLLTMTVPMNGLVQDIWHFTYFCNNNLRQDLVFIVSLQHPCR